MEKEIDFKKLAKDVLPNENDINKKYEKIIKETFNDKDTINHYLTNVDVKLAVMFFLRQKGII